jgi:peptidoglycan-associated lipoprotein
MKTAKLAFLIALVGFFAACSGARPRKKGASDRSKTAASDGTDSGVAPDVSVEEASLRGKDFQSVDALEAIYFDYDSASLKEEQLTILKNNAQYLKAHAGIELLVAGYCDERGTTEYNLALGQKRAKEVREYYMRLGIPAKSVATISYGKESPVCTEPDEDCWGKNRRAETKVRVSVSSNGSSKAPEESAQ